MKVARFIGMCAIGALLLLLLALWLPIGPRFPAHPQPSADYAAALTRFAEIERNERATGDKLLAECHSQLLTHGQRVTHAIVFFHGIANCPAQFATLGQKFYALGYNVLIPRLPHHGWADPMTTEIANLTAEELVATADTAADIAVGLGDQVTVVGFSTGGVLAGWVANRRGDVAQSVLMSAFLGPKGYPAWIVHPLARVLLILPNQFWWWDDDLKENLPGPRYAYPRYPSHAIAQIMRLSFAVQQQANRQPPRSDAILVITNAGPRESVDNAITAQLVRAWQRHGMARISFYQFPRELDIDHDYMSIEAPHQPVDVVTEIYPVLIHAIQGMDAPDD